MPSPLKHKAPNVDVLAQNVELRRTPQDLTFILECALIELPKVYFSFPFLKVAESLKKIR